MRGRPETASHRLKLFPLIAAAMGAAKDVPTGDLVAAIGEDAGGNPNTLRNRVHNTLRVLRRRGLIAYRLLRQRGTKGPPLCYLWTLTAAGLAAAELVSADSHRAGG